MQLHESQTPGLEARPPWSGELEGAFDIIRSDYSASYGSQVPARLEAMIAGVQGRAGQMIARVLGGFRYGSTAFMKRRSKRAGATAAHQSSAIEDELPEHYGHSRVVLLVIDPHHVHVYWELSAQDRLDAKQRLNPPDPDQALTWVLRFYDVTGVEFDTINAHAHFDIVVKPGARSWYVELWSANKSYYVELGPRAEGRFVPVCRSSPIQVPPAERWSPPASADRPASPGFELEQEATGSAPPEAAPVCEPLSAQPPSEVPYEGPSLADAVTSVAELPPTRVAALGGPARDSTPSASAEPEQQLEPSRSVSLASESSGSGSAWQPPK